MTDSNENENALQPNAEDAALLRLVAAHTVPEPTVGFVEETTLRLQLHTHETPPPSSAFVDRVMQSLQASTARRPEAAAGEGPASRPDSPWPKIVAAMIAAAAIGIALLPRANLPLDVPADRGFGRSVAGIMDATSPIPSNQLPRFFLPATIPFSVATSEPAANR